MNKKIGNNSILIIVILIFSIAYLSVGILNIRSSERIENAKLNLKYREYVSSRMHDCYKIETLENDNWENFSYGYYDIESDVCWMKYITDDEENPTWRQY